MCTNEWILSTHMMWLKQEKLLFHFLLLLIRWASIQYNRFLHQMVWKKERQLKRLTDGSIRLKPDNNSLTVLCPWSSQSTPLQITLTWVQVMIIQRLHTLANLSLSSFSTNFQSFQALSVLLSVSLLYPFFLFQQTLSLSKLTVSLPLRLLNFQSFQAFSLFLCLSFNKLSLFPNTLSLS